MMKRSDCLAVLATHRTNEIVAVTFSAVHQWIALSPSDLNYTFVGVSGQTASHGLGLALAFPHRRVVVIDSTTSLLTNLGCLVSVARTAPENFVHLVLSDGDWDCAAGRTAPPGQRTSLACIARAAGYPLAREYEDLTQYQAEIGELLSASGPVFAEIKISPEEDRQLEQRTALFSEERQRTFQWAAMSDRSSSAAHSLIDGDLPQIPTPLPQSRSRLQSVQRTKRRVKS